MNRSVLIAGCRFVARSCFQVSSLSVVLLGCTMSITLAAEASKSAWSYFPTAQQIGKQELPVWADALAPRMPEATIGLLNLDTAHRTVGPVPKNLRAAMRWSAAKANGASYFMRQSEFDAKAAGETQQRWANLVDGDQSQWSKAERAALDCAQAMTVDSDAYPDSKFDELVKQFSPEIAASMVLHMAFANFQDRLSICLGVANSDKAVLPPLDVAFDMPGLLEASRNHPPGSPPAPKTDAIVDKSVQADKAAAPHDLVWLNYDGLQKRLTDQRNRNSRLPSPPWSQIEKKLPAGLFEKPSDITWYQLSLGYAPELTVPFQYYMEIAGTEVSKDWDRLFGGSLFWMVTNSIHCPYCMGHCEMNWEVAGLDIKGIEDLSRHLAENDWSNFTPPQQRALKFARKLTQSPKDITADDMKSLEEDWGHSRATRIALQCSRYNYMVRISNGFQLQLESENVFWDYYGMPKPGTAPATK